MAASFCIVSSPTIDLGQALANVCVLFLRRQSKKPSARRLAVTVMKLSAIWALFDRTLTHGRLARLRNGIIHGIFGVVMEDGRRPGAIALTFETILELDAIRRENHCHLDVCAYEDDCVCWRELKEQAAPSRVLPPA
jgi:hypothetical protein